MRLVAATSAFLVSALLVGVATAWLRGVLLRVGMLDQPNARSMHKQATPRGAGLGFACVALAMEAVLLALGVLPLDFGIALIGVGSGFALLGGADDYRARTVSGRFVIQIVLAMCFALAVVGQLPTDWRLFLRPPVLLTGVVLAIVWYVNLYNFMDGVDGYAATQGLLAALGGGCVFSAAGDFGVALVLLVTAGCCAGFLPWNWPPARIFMGDSGSYFLGFQFAAGLLLGATTSVGSAPILILTSPFVADATFTLLRRMLSRRRWWRAHREHAFQQLILRGWSEVALLRRLIVLNLLVVWPLALYAAMARQKALACVLIAYALAGIMWFLIVRPRRDRKCQN